jgi:hypothetical protein
MLSFHDLNLINLVVTFGLMILIWIIQILHYPSFHFYQLEDFDKAMIFHQKYISILTIPLMLTELFITSYLFYHQINLINSISILIVLIIWLSTFFVQVPIHEKLLKNKDTHLIDQLVKTNWARTILWTAKLILLVATYSL